MFNPKTLLKALAIICVLLAAAAATSAPVPDHQPATGPDPAFKTVMQPDLSLRSQLAPGLLPSAPGGTKTGFCQCGCGITFTSSADCGGAPCRPFITCCDKDPQNEWFHQGAALSSHRNGEPAINIKCK